MNRTTIEYVLNCMYVALVSAGMNDNQRARANDVLFRCAELNCAPPFAPEILRRIAGNAVTQEALFDLPQPPPSPPSSPRPSFRVIDGGSAA